MFNSPLSHTIRREQFAAFVGRLPYLYGAVLITNLLVAYVCADVPALRDAQKFGYALDAVIAWRLIHWLRFDPSTIDEALIKRTMASIAALGCALTFALTAWGLHLYSLAPTNSEGRLSIGGFLLIVESVDIVAATALMAPIWRMSAAAVTLFAVTNCSYLFIVGERLEAMAAVSIAIFALLLTGAGAAASRDLDELLEARDRLARSSEDLFEIAHTDTVTGLANRRRFFDEVSAAESGGEDFLLAALDLDSFKQVNDVYGHKAGDEVLGRIAERIRERMPEGVVAARLGGDEFGLFMRGAHFLETGPRLLDELARALNLPIETADGQCAVGVSVGYSTSRVSAGAPSQEADAALFEAKRRGRNCVVAFTSELAETRRRRDLIDIALRSGDLAETVQAYFQPLVHAETFEIYGYEALARWVDPKLGAVSPAEFIPVAERNGTVRAITRVILAQALETARQTPKYVKMSINLSAQDVSSELHVLGLIAMIEGSGVAPQRLTFEITETSLVTDIAACRRSLERLRAIGCAIAIDDFGCGYSSLTYIHQLAPDYVKIDRSFVTDVAGDSKRRLFLGNMLDMCANIGAFSVAEGVETQEQAATLRALGCFGLQGYLFGRPEPWSKARRPAAPAEDDEARQSA